ncbi:MAG: hypothetical protein NT027_11020, partial [Proteobacteria bacterium]|nr:hypothetical protein [Pseudomonadota bacterium]
MKEIQKDSVDWLRHELATRQDKNPAYSMRAFAKLTGTTPGRMSEYLSRKRPLTDRMIGKFIN